MATTLALPLLGLAAWPDPAILTGHLAPASLRKYRQALTAYLAFCGTPAQALQATSLARWRTHLAQHTRLSPATINWQLAAVKRLVKEAAAQGYVDVVTAAAFTAVTGVKPQALKDRLKATARTRITPGQMRPPVRRARSADAAWPPRSRPAGHPGELGLPRLRSRHADGQPAHPPRRALRAPGPGQEPNRPPRSPPEPGGLHAH